MGLNIAIYIKPALFSQIYHRPGSLNQHERAGQIRAGLLHDQAKRYGVQISAQNSRGTGIFHNHPGTRAELADERDCVIVDGACGFQRSPTIRRFCSAQHPAIASVAVSAAASMPADMLPARISSTTAGDRNASRTTRVT